MGQEIPVIWGGGGGGGEGRGRLTTGYDSFGMLSFIYRYSY